MYLEYVRSSTDNHRSGEKFHCVRTLWFVLQKPLKVFTSGWQCLHGASWSTIFTALFGFDLAKNNLDYISEYLFSDGLAHIDYLWTGINGLNLKPSTRFLDVPPEPIWSHWLARVTISCMQYLHRRDPNTSLTQVHLREWAMKSKRSPWLWRQRMRVTSTRRCPDLDDDGPTYSFPQSLRRSHQILYSERIQSKKFYQKRHVFYILTLDILYRILCKARKSDELTRKLSKPFIPSSATLLFPLRIKHIRKAAATYLEKVSRRACSNLRFQLTLSGLIYVLSKVHLNL